MRRNWPLISVLVILVVITIGTMMYIAGSVRENQFEATSRAATITSVSGTNSGIDCNNFRCSDGTTYYYTARPYTPTPSTTKRE